MSGRRYFRLEARICPRRRMGCGRVFHAKPSWRDEFCSPACASRWTGLCHAKRADARWEALDVARRERGRR